jgi:hypothetical protein
MMQPRGNQPTDDQLTKHGQTLFYYLMKFSKLLLFTIITTFARADIQIFPVDEKKLPYQYSPANFDISPSNFKNTISNFDNSSSNFNNLSSNFENSPSNYENTKNGNRSIIVEEENKLIHYGYYVSTDNGVTNFFSVKGKRIFYSPKGSKGVYHGTKGFFCGVMAKIEGEMRLALTEQGMRVLLLPD